MLRKSMPPSTTGSILRFTDGRRSGSGAELGLRFQTTPRGLRPRGGPSVLKYISTFRSGDARGAAAGRGGRAGRRKSALLAPAPACRPALEREFQAVVVGARRFVDSAIPYSHS